MPEISLVLLVGVAAGALNAVGGGGTFVALPALVATGLSPVTANASSTIALVPGALAGAWVHRRELAPVGGTSTRALTATSVLGGAFGAALLLVLPSASFTAAVPWLLALATVLLAFGRPLSRVLSTGGTTATGAGGSVVLSPRTVLVAQFLVAVYGGYFGGAVGIMMLAFWSIGLGLDTAAGNPMRIAQLAALNLSATALFLLASDALRTPAVLVDMLVGAVLGGFAGAHLARRLPARLLRGIILAVAVTMTVLYFLRG
ncbi:sulfite exporter TauE/SafE family protein [Streptomyces sp. IB2014 016-6]|uniref:sulfite exporter TauE/SafE family protein n=1 Tax=Streptomyces sp. IB2014 016-6 TaxID=2517818 RepID=UPI0011CC4C62|nr:sulfite exporter TauE/SafE family protein [Streptomyces sp. IB2014 016-6]TXL89805.1 sulfite exporter TauE/SafE family protein [Streptomyces sp. IB2014 016-6]